MLARASCSAVGMAYPVLLRGLNFYMPEASRGEGRRASHAASMVGNLTSDSPRTWAPTAGIDAGYSTA